jgi:hypothetical protein
MKLKFMILFLIISVFNISAGLAAFPGNLIWLTFRPEMSNRAVITGYITGKTDGDARSICQCDAGRNKNRHHNRCQRTFSAFKCAGRRHSLVITGMGYVTEKIEVEIVPGRNLEINIELDYRGLDLDEVVVTSSPTARGFRYQPDNVFTGEQLQRRADISFGEMLDGEPGISMRSMGPTPSRPVIRGLDGDRILILQNGERMGDLSETAAGHAISLDPLSANRVEVVRGPASLLYGSSAIGGVINLMTGDIPDAWDNGPSGVVSLQGASNNNMGAGFGTVYLGQ